MRHDYYEYNITTTVLLLILIMKLLLGYHIHAHTAWKIPTAALWTTTSSLRQQYIVFDLLELCFTNIIKGCATLAGLQGAECRSLTACLNIRKYLISTARTRLPLPRILPIKYSRCCMSLAWKSRRYTSDDKI